ncbi:MAG: HypC/HybG/HupF family hydrogenase formation chaperone [bacterium]
MCLAIPVRVLSIEENAALIEFGGVRRPVDLRLLENVQVGDYVLVHAGFAIQRLDEEEARKTLELFREISGERP